MLEESPWYHEGAANHENGFAKTIVQSLFGTPMTLATSMYGLIILDVPLHVSNLAALEAYYKLYEKASIPRPDQPGITFVSVLKGRGLETYRFSAPTKEAFLSLLSQYEGI